MHALLLEISVLGTLDPDQEQIDCRMKAIKHKILIVSGKGGRRNLETRHVDFAQVFLMQELENRA